MTNGFPPTSPRPTYYCHITSTNRNHTWYVGDSGFTFTLSQPDGHGVSATGYTVRDFYGNTVVTGSFASGTTVFSLATPGGGWKPGWYRLYITGPLTDTVFGGSYGITNFQVLRVNSHFPTMPSPSAANGTNAGAPVDAILRGVCGIGPNRYSITNMASPASQIAEIQNCLTIEANYYANPSYQDSVRPRDLFCSFPSGGYDVVGIGGLRAFAKTPGAANLYIQVANGTSSGFKVTVATPDAATVVETYDNCADVPAVIAAAAGSPRVVFTGLGSTGVGGPFAIATTNYSAVVSTVSALYPAGIKWYEGPSNEPSEDGSATNAQAMRVFQAAVKAGNASAKALGPCHVSENFGAAAMNTFLSQGGGNYCDGFSYHAYNMCMGDPNIARAAYPPFLQVLANYPSQTTGKPIWQTEQGVFTPVSGTYHPRKARWQMMQLLIQEQYGIPRERNHMWYDMSHGFWSQPTWLENGDTSVNPQVTLARVMAEELFGKAHESVLDFGDPGKRIFVGSSFLSPNDGSRVLVLMAASPLDNNNVTFTLAGAAPSSVTAVDGFGNTSTATVTSGRVTVAVTDVPVYVRLPAGVTASVYQIAGWPTAATARVNLGQSGLYGASLNGSTVRTNWQPLSSITSGTWQIAGYNYDNAFQSSVTTMPDTVTVQWASHPTTVDRVVIWSGFAYQAQCALVKFDVQTSTDGATWTTQASVDKSSVMSSFAWGSDDQNTGTTADTFWPEQWIFDVPFAVPVRASYLRIVARQTSLGGAPDATAITAGDLADDGSQRVTISQLGVYSDDSLKSRYVTLT